MTMVAIVPISDANGERVYQAIAGDKHSIGKTAGAALDSLTAQLESGELSDLLVIQSFRSDGFFSIGQQHRLTELMALWRAARDRGETLPPEQQMELDCLTDAELKAATARSAVMAEQLNR
jgi:hypothetical protein